MGVTAAPCTTYPASVGRPAQVSALPTSPMTNCRRSAKGAKCRLAAASRGEASMTMARALASRSSQRRTTLAMTKPPPPVMTPIFDPFMSSLRSCRHPAAVDHQIDPGHEARHVARQKQSGGGDIIRPAEPRPGGAALGAGEARRIVVDPGLAGDDLTRRHRIADDQILGMFDRDLPGDIDGAGFADAIGRVSSRGHHAMLGGDIDDPS